MLLHDLKDFPELIEVTADSFGIDPGLVGKDYWIMHALWGLQQLRFELELKEISRCPKGYQLIHRFFRRHRYLHPPGKGSTGRAQPDLQGPDGEAPYLLRCLPRLVDALGLEPRTC